MVSAVPMDDLSTLGNDTYPGMRAKPTHPSMHMFQAPRGFPKGFAPPADHMVYLSPGSLFKDELAHEEDTTLTDEHQYPSRRRYYCMALLCTPLLVGLLMVLIWSLAASSNQESLLPAANPPVPSHYQSVSPTIVSFISPIAPASNIHPPVQPSQSMTTWPRPLPAGSPLVLEEQIVPPTFAPTTPYHSTNTPVERPTDIVPPRPHAPSPVALPTATVFQPMPVEQPSITSFQPVPIASGREYNVYPTTPLDARDFQPEPTLAPLHRATMSPMDQPPSERLTVGPQPEPTRSKGSSSTTPPSSDSFPPTPGLRPTRSPHDSPFSLPSDPSSLTSQPSLTAQLPASSLRPTTHPTVRTITPNVPPSDDPSPLPDTAVPNLPSTPEPSAQSSPAPTAKQVVSTGSPTPNPTAIPPVESPPDPSPDPTQTPPRPEATPEPTSTEQNPETPAPEASPEPPAPEASPETPAPEVAAETPAQEASAEPPSPEATNAVEDPSPEENDESATIEIPMPNLIDENDP